MRIRISLSVDDFFAKMDKQRTAEQVKYKVRPGEAAEQAKFLKGWSKGKPISKQDPNSTSTFWKCGKWMTKIEPKVVQEMLKLNLIERQGSWSFIVK